MMYAFVCRNGQRPGVVSGMTVQEYEEASHPSSDTLVVLVKSHKGARPARVVTSDRTITELNMWATTFRPLLVKKDSPLLFCTKGGERLQQISRRLPDIAQSFGATIHPATDVRKAIATAGGALGEGEKAALAHFMSHSMSTSNQYYRAYGEAKSVEGFEAVGNILEVPRIGKKRQKFTVAETKSISKHFTLEISQKV